MNRLMRYAARISVFASILLALGGTNLSFAQSPAPAECEGALRAPKGVYPEPLKETSAPSTYSQRVLELYKFKFESMLGLYKLTNEKDFPSRFRMATAIHDEYRKWESSYKPAEGARDEAMVAKLTADSAPARDFHSEVLSAVKKFEASLSQEEIKKITAANPGSRFRYMKRFCSQAQDCDACSEADVRALLKKDPRLTNQSHLIAVMDLNSAREDYFWKDYHSALIAIAKAKKAPEEVLAYYTVRQQTVEEPLKAERKRVEEVRFSELRLAGVTGDDKKLDAYAKDILAAAPFCAYLDERSLTLYRNVMGKAQG